MRLLRLDFGSEFRSLDLHPLLNVVSDVSPSHQRQLFDAIRTLASGSTLGVRGLVEHQGLLVELDGQYREPFAGAVTSADVVVFADDTSTGASLLSFEDEVAFWQRREAIDTALLEEIRADLDAAAKSEVTSLRRRLEPDLRLNDLGSASDRSDEPERDVEELRRRVVRSAIREAEETEPYQLSGDPEVLDLLERWEAFVEIRSENEAHLGELRSAIESAQEQWKASSRALAEAKAEAQPIRLTKDEATRLEQLSDAENEGGRKGLSGADQAEMQELLDKVGASSWTDYALARSNPRVPAAKLALVQEAEQQVALDEKAVADARQAASSDPVSAQMGKTHAAMKDDARPHLGAVMPNDIGAGLRALISEVENPEWLRSINRLRDTLSSNDLQPPYGVGHNEVLGWAKAWLAGQEALTEDTGAGESDGNSAEIDDPKELAAALEEAESRLIRHRRAILQIEPAERRAMLSQVRLDRVHQQMSERSTASAPRSAGEVLQFLEPVLRQMKVDGGGQVPIVIAGAMTELDSSEINELVSTLQRLSMKLQVILITNREEALVAAAEFGLEKAGVTRGLKSLV